MQLLSFPTALCFVAFVSAVSIRSPVCIVGAGPAGLAAASRLESLGQTTVIFEKQARVGGKSQAIYDQDGRYYPLGALLFTKLTYTETFKIINSTGVPYIPFDYGQTWDYNWTTGITQLQPVAPAVFVSLLTDEIARYSVYWETFFGPYYSVTPGYKNGVPEEFTVTTGQWLEENNYQALPVLVIDAMVPYGYGDLRQVPILYILQYLTPDILLTFAENVGGFLIDFHKVFTQFAQSIRGPIQTSTTISKIDRTGTTTRISYHKGSTHDIQTQLCSAVILAFPPTLSNLKAANLDLSPNETTVFTPVGVNNYYSGALRIKSPSGLFKADQATPYTPPDADGEPIAFIHLWNKSEIATTFSWGAYHENQSFHQAKELLKSTLTSVNEALNPGTGGIDNGDVLAFVKHDYFPHFDPEQLASGWYGKFNALQGQQKTYYASGLNMFETVEGALRAGYDVVDSFF